MNSKCQRVELNDGHFIPVLGFGTALPLEVPKSKIKELTKIAIDAGFRHFDSASVYKTEDYVGEVIRSKIADGTVRREDVFYTTKVWCNCLRPELVRSSLEQSLKKVQLDYVDLYLMHYPVALKPGEDEYPVDEHGKLIFDIVDLCATWEAMERCKEAGLTKSIGVSNFNRRQLETILNKPGLKYKPVCNQVECHPYLNQMKLLDFCKSNDIVLVAYGVLGTQRYTGWVDQNSPVLLDEPVLCSMAKKYNQTPALIALRYQLQRGVVALNSTLNEKRVKENIKVFEFQLSSEDMKVLDGLNRNLRYLNTPMDLLELMKGLIRWNDACRISLRVFNINGLLATLIIHFLMNTNMCRCLSEGLLAGDCSRANVLACNFYSIAIQNPLELHFS